MKTPPQPKAPRARVMITNASGFNPNQNRMVAWVPEAVSKGGNPTAEWPHVISILPRSKEAQEKLIEAGAKAMWDQAEALYHPMKKRPFKTADEQLKAHRRAQARACFASANLVEKE